MPGRPLFLTIFSLCACLPIAGQEASSGISVPITVSGELRYANGSAGESESANLDPGFRVLASPALKLGSHWFLYSTLEAHSSSYFPYQTGASDASTVQLNVMQAFIGYTANVSGASILVKAGQLSSAFGLFPLDYDDANEPLINPPLAYTANLPLRSDQLPCGVNDILGQEYGSDIQYHCGGPDTERYGLVPVTLYGLPSVEVQLSLARFDARAQITNSSPVNPQGLESNSQFGQWTIGGGFTFPEGLHIGMSAFKGPYLDRTIAPLLPVGTGLRSFPATGIGVDAQWSRSAWSAEGEWQHFRFALPDFGIPLSETVAYAQVKRIVSPRLFLVMRVNSQRFGRVEDRTGANASQAASPQQVYELGAGYRLNRQQLLKAGANWSNRNAWSVGAWRWPQSEGYGFELQLVTAFTPFSKAFR